MRAGRQTSVAIQLDTRKLIEFLAADSYPKEVGGVLIGEHAIDSACPIILADKSSSHVCWPDESRARAEDMFDISGEWHTHTSGLTILSSTDRSGMAHEEFEWLVNVFPGRRRFRFIHRVYLKLGERVYRLKPIWW